MAFESEYLRRQEIANSVTHGLGVALSVAGLVVLVVLASLHATVWHVVSFSVYGASLVLLYTSSTLYHSFRSPRLKQVFHILDHSSIYLLIAGSYTPFVLVNLRGSWGWSRPAMPPAGSAAGRAWAPATSTWKRGASAARR